MELQIGGITVQIERKRIRNIHLYVRPPMGEVKVTAPYGTSDATIIRFVSSHLDWIRQKTESFKSRAASGFRFRGVSYNFVTRVGRSYSVRIEGGDFIFTAREGSTDEQRAKWLDSWLRDDLRSRIPAHVAKWESATGLHPSGWSVRAMKTRWGTCNTKTAKIWLALQLAGVSDECLDYVVLHEIAHLAAPNHGPDFKAILDRHMPDWRRIRKSLLS